MLKTIEQLKTIELSARIARNTGIDVATTSGTSWNLLQDHNFFCTCFHCEVNVQEFSGPNNPCAVATSTIKTRCPRKQELVKVHNLRKHLTVQCFFKLHDDDYFSKEKPKLWTKLTIAQLNTRKGAI